MYYYGTASTKKNLDLSLTWYKLAAAGELPRAMHDMACFYADGVPDRIPINAELAVDLWRKAANAGEYTFEEIAAF
jgi:TPR repeat protein